MKILIDARMIAWPGIGRYTERLLQQLESINDTDTYAVLMLPKDRARWQPKTARFSVVYANIRPYGFAEQTRLPALLYRLNPDLVHFLHFTAPIAYRGRYVVTIHDLILMRYQNLRGSTLRKSVYKAKLQVMNHAISSAAKRAETVITDTQFVKDDIIANLKIPPAKITVISLASEALMAKAEPITRFSLGNDFIFYVGSFFPYKNIGRLIDALKELLPTHPKLRLVLAGKLDSFSDALKKHAKELGVADKIIFTGFVSNGELVSFYQAASVYTFPSLAEGFGLPGLEAMSYGLPVVSSNATCLPEVYGDAAVYFNPLDVNDMAAKISEVLDNKSLREDLRRRGLARVKDFSWERMAKETLEVYKKALKP
jgi:glycosyltransferase involved in cell wall biosynthesis